MLLCLPFLQLLSLATLFIMLFLLLKTLFAKYHPLHLKLFTNTKYFHLQDCASIRYLNTTVSVRTLKQNSALPKKLNFMQLPLKKHCEIGGPVALR